MVSVYVGIGSNVERERSIRGGVESLRSAFGDLVLSPVYESAPVGFEGAPFYNLVAGFDSDLDPLALKAKLTEIERQHGRDREKQRFSERPLDLDLLLYGGLVTRIDGLALPRPDIAHYAFVLRPLSDIAGDLRHPVNGRRIADLWASYDQSRQPLCPVFLSLDRHEESA